MPTAIAGLVEGQVDEAVLGRLVAEAGGVLGPVYGKQGKDHLLLKLQGYDQAARHEPWAVLVDLDQDEECAPAFRARHLAAPAAYMCFRVVVHELEAWLLGDPVTLAKFLAIEAKKIPTDPDAVANPKQTMVNLARKSRSRALQMDMVPRTGRGSVGPAYNARVTEYVLDHWRPDIAANTSDSLRRCRIRLQELVEKFP